MQPATEATSSLSSIFRVREGAVGFASPPMNGCRSGFLNGPGQTEHNENQIKLADLGFLSINRRQYSEFVIALLHFNSPGSRSHDSFLPPHLLGGGLSALDRYFFFVELMPPFAEFGFVPVIESLAPRPL
jgi:hypothetical protein